MSVHDLHDSTQKQIPARLKRTDNKLTRMDDYRNTESDGKGSPPQSPDGKKSNPAGACCFLGCLGIGACVALFIAAIFLGGFALGIADAKKGYESKSWPTAEGKILSTEIEARKSTSRDSRTRRERTTTSYHGVVKYEYLVSGQTHQSDRISYKSYGGSQEHAKMVVAAYPVGSPVTVHYNPGKPAESVLEPGVGWASFMGPLIWGSPFVIAILVVGGMIVRARNKRAA